jgi:hypothetical protein
MRKRHSWLGMLLVATYCTTWFSRPATAEVTVIDSDLYKIGQQLPDDATLDIRECETLVLFTRSHSIFEKGGKFLELPGPYHGPLRTYKDAGRRCQSSKPASRPGELGASAGERKNVYYHYFLAVCSKGLMDGEPTHCDATCKAVIQKLTDMKMPVLADCP